MKIPRGLDVRRCLSVLLARHNNGRYMGVGKKSGFVLGMEQLSHVLRIKFKHQGADDCLKQLIAWRYLIEALRRWYGY